MKSSTHIVECDIAVIGGGPAGMMAAGTAGSFGADVVLFEKNGLPGRKLLLTGKGRCNITNADYDPQSFLANFGKKGRYLNSPLHSFGVEETMNFFEGRGLPLKVERGNRVFPESDRAADVLRVLRDYLKENGARIQAGHEIIEMVNEGGHIHRIIARDRVVYAGRYILCTGGLSYRETGSDGAGLEFAKKLGHTIIRTRPSLVPVVLKERWAGELEGLSLKNVSVSLMHGEKKVSTEFGEALFTSNGMSGPVILDLSRKIGELLPGSLELSIDFKPALDLKTLDERIRRDFSAQPTRFFKNSLGMLLPATLIPVIVRLSKIDAHKTVSHVTRDERKRLALLLKDLRLRVAGTEGFDMAIVTAGGVSLDEVDMRTMRSRIIDNLYFAGEMLDIDGPTGGFNLQVCWSTGYAAGKAAAEASGK
jgi:predicted Rossmann fold flavoprotein